MLRCSARAICLACAVLLAAISAPDAFEPDTSEPFGRFAVNLRDAVNAGDTAFLSSSTNLRELWRTASGPALLDSTQEAMVLAALARSIIPALVLISGDSSTFAITGMTPRGATCLITYRAYSEHGLTFVTVTAESQTESILITNWRNHLTGVTLRDLVDMVAGTVGDTASPHRLDPRIARIASLLAQADTSGAQRALWSMEEPLASSPIIVSLRATIAQSEGPEALEQFGSWIIGGRERIRRYPLLALPHLASAGKYRKVDASIRMIEGEIGRDAAVTSLRAQVLAARGKHGKALDAYADAIELDPSFEPAYWRVLDILVTQRAYADAVLVLDILAIKFGYSFDIEKLTEVSGYRDFARSSELRAWVDTIEERER